jgi:hypothetical protein
MIRILFYVSCENCEKPLHFPDSIVRKGSYFYEIDKKFRDLQEGTDFLRFIDHPFEICIFVNQERISNEGEIRAAIETGLSLMVEEKYWLAHEVFEGLWKHNRSNAGKFFHAVTLFCVSMVHSQMNHRSNAVRIFDIAKSEMNQFLGDTSKEWSFSYPIDSRIIEQIEDSALSIIGN